MQHQPESSSVYIEQSQKVGLRKGSAKGQVKRN